MLLYYSSRAAHVCPRLLTSAHLYQARDVARAALSLPLWTLSPMPLEEVVALAQTTPGELAATKRLKADGLLTTEELQKNNGYDKRTPQEVAKERASFLLDLVRG